MSKIFDFEIDPVDIDKSLEEIAREFEHDLSDYVAWLLNHKIAERLSLICKRPIENFEFHGPKRDGTLPKYGGIYIGYDCTGGRVKFAYVGQSANISRRIDTRHKVHSFPLICLKEESATRRTMLELELIYQLRPALNVQHII